MHFCSNYQTKENIKEKVEELFQNLINMNIIDKPIIPKEKFHYYMFSNITYENLPEKDNRYILLKNKVKTIMGNDL